MRASRVMLLAACLLTAGCAGLGNPFGPGERVGPGAQYVDYLAGTSDKIVVELDYAPGALWDPSTPAPEDFEDQVEWITDKAVEVRASQDLPREGDDYTYSLAELDDLHAEHLDTEANETVSVMHALFVDGELGGSVAGVAFDDDAFALFKGHISEVTCDNDADVCTRGDPVAVSPDPNQLLNQGSVREWKVTRSVAIHEAGHLLGLVNSPLPMVEPHEMNEDPNPDTPQNEGEAHSTNESSVMFWKVANTAELDDIVDGGEVPHRFGPLDVKDARSIQQGAAPRDATGSDSSSGLFGLLDR